ncbi:MAG TPA: IS66 family transposase [Kiritimatiellia bacterium]|nr:IS66 family transposase [Kiritimatiellia bacterium]HMP00386.1 IS66 family transposase [Kiritimatiellia bacterium]
MTDEQAEELKKKVEHLERMVAQKDQEIAWLKLKLDALARRYFGRKSEELDRRQLEFLLGLVDPPMPPASADAAIPEAVTKPRRTKKPCAPRCPDNLPVEIEVLDPAPVVENQPLYRKIGEEVSEQFDYQPGYFLKRRLVRRTWVKRNDPDAVPLTAPLPPKLKERGLLAPGLLAHITVSKYVDHQPLYRQQQGFQQRHDVYLPRQTMARGIELVADWMRPVAEQVLIDLLVDGYVQIDETPVKYLEPGYGKTKQGYFWVLRSPDAAYYHWADGRSHKHLLELLPESFKGVVQCDAHSAYGTMADKRPDIQLAGCWAHARRKFHEALVLKEQVVRNRWILHQIGLLYMIEKRLRESRAGPALRSAIRCSESRPILKRLKKLLIKISSELKPKSLTGMAVSYALGQWKLLEVYLDKGVVEIDNNLVENAIRPTALGRKNWLFIGAEGAGWRSAVIYTIIQSCKVHGVEPYAYLKDVLTRLPAMNNHQIPDITPKAWAKAQRAALKSAA